MMSPEERTYGGHTLEYWLPWLEETVAKVVQPGSQTTALLEAMQHIKALRAERPSSEELASLKAERETFLVGLNDWATSYAPDMCSDEAVEATQKRIAQHGGTLAYIAHLTSSLSSKERTGSLADTDMSEGG